LARLPKRTLTELEAEVWDHYEAVRQDERDLQDKMALMQEFSSRVSPYFAPHSGAIGECMKFVIHSYALFSFRPLGILVSKRYFIKPFIVSIYAQSQIFGLGKMNPEKSETDLPVQNVRKPSQV